MTQRAKSYVFQGAVRQVRERLMVSREDDLSHMVLLVLSHLVDFCTEVTKVGGCILVGVS